MFSLLQPITALPHQLIRRLSLRTYLILAFLFNTFFTLTVLTVTHHSMMTRALTEEISEDLREVSYLKATTVASFLTRRVNILQTFALDPTLSASLTNSPDRATTLNIPHHPMVTDLARLRQLFPEFVELFVTDQRGRAVAALEPPSDEYQADEFWWQRAFSDGRGAVYIGTPAFDESSQTLGIAMAVPIYAPETGEVVGVLRATVEAGVLQQLLEVREAGKVGQATLLFPDESTLGSSPILPNMGAIPATMFLTSEAPVAPITGEAYVAELGWVLRFQSSREEALATLDAQGWQTLLLALGLGSLATLMTIPFYQQVTTPLQRLVQVANRLATGEFSARAGLPPTLREVSQLAHSFDQMAAALEAREAELRTTRARYRALVEQLPAITYVDTILTQDPPVARPLYLSPQFETLLGYSAATYLADPALWPHLLHPEDRERVLAAQEHHYRSGEPLSLDYRLVTRTGTDLWVHDVAVMVYDELTRSQMSLGLLLDSNARRQAELALIEERALLARRVAEQTADLSLANAELAQAARAKDEFLASMSHELRTPLNAILSLSESLEEGVYGLLSEPQKQGLRIIAESGQHLLSLINDILDLSKIEAGKLHLDLEAVDVRETSEASLRLVRGQAMQKRLSVHHAADARVGLILADKRRLKQILVNLLGNAIKFTPEEGQVGLQVEADPAQQALHLTVWDTGIGIAPDELPRLFQPFIQLDSRLSREYAGTGLGLALVRRLVEMHGGSVSVESAPEAGSRFTVSLPWILPPNGAPTEGESAEGGLRWHSERALVIEDSPSAAEQLVRYVRELGASAVVHPHGKGAVRQAVALQPDVILLDLLLPDESGWEVLTRLQTDPRTRGIPIVIISVVDEVAEGRVRGASAYLVKPITRAHLRDALQQTLPLANEHPTVLAVLSEEKEPLVLIVDDSLITRQTVADYLDARGYQVATAQDGLEALEQAAQHSPDIILMDIQMPGLDGLETIRRMRTQSALTDTPIIALTALAMTGDRERCLAAGADDYLSKPVGLKKLVETIESRLRKDMP